MPQFLRKHIRRENIGKIDFEANRERTLTLTTGGEQFFRLMFITLTATIAGAATAADEVKAQEGILALIDTLEVKINNTQSLFKSSGLQLMLDHYERFGIAPRGTLNPATTIAEQTLSVTVPYFFDAGQYADGGDVFGLDLRDETGNASLINDAKLSVRWADTSSIFEAEGDLAVTSAKIEINGVLHRSLGPSVRASEMITRIEEFKYTADGNGLVEIPRISGATLLDAIIVQDRQGRPVPFDDETAFVRVEHDTYVWIDEPINVLRAQDYAIRQAEQPSNVLRVPLTDYRMISTGRHNSELADELEMTVPVNTTADGAGDHRLRVFLRYARLARVE